MLSERSNGPEQEQALMTRVVDRDRDAFAALFDRCGPSALGLLTKILRNREQAEDVLQDVFLHVWSEAHKYDPRRASVRGWILLLARSKALDVVRSGTSRGRREQAVHEERERSQGLAMPATGTRRLEQEERAHAVSDALSVLPDEQRHAIELAFFEGLTQSEIARRQEAPLGTVKSRVLLGMKKLRHALQERRLGS